MQLPFLDRDEERARLRSLVRRPTGGLAVVYGRRRCGKSRLLHEVLSARSSVYYVGDDRDAALQRASLAAEVGRVLAGFDAVSYPTWDALLDRWYREASRGMTLALDEFPALVSAARELPSLLQKRLDRPSGKAVHLVLAGSSQRLMQGLILDRSAPLFGRAAEILRIGPLPAGWIARALRIADPLRAVEAYAVWGGIPRYWELAAEFASLDIAMRALVLSPLGVLHDEPAGLLLDDLRDTTQAASILSLVGRGAHRLSEIAARLERPATSLTRPLSRLVDLGLVRREVPFGVSPRDAKRSLYRIGDPFLRFWFRFVDPARSRLEAGRVGAVAQAISRDFPHHVAGVWEDLARASVSRLGCFGREWDEAGRWWGPGLDGRPMEIDVVARSADGRAVLIGEAMWTARTDRKRAFDELRRKAENLPMAEGREVHLAVFSRDAPRGSRDPAVFTPRRVLPALR